MDNEFKSITKIVGYTFPSGLKESTLDFLSYLNSKALTFERLFGYWKNQFYYSVKYNNESVCYILLNGTGGEQQFAPLTVWSDDSGSDWYKNYPLDNKSEEIAWNNIDFCVHCGSCPGGTKKIVFGREFNNICRTTFRFTNLNEKEFALIKVLINARIENIKGQCIYD